MMRNFPKIFLRAQRAFEFSHGLREVVFLYGHHNAPSLLALRRRGDRIEMLFGAVHESGCGP
jgi:hypothetical protein